MYIGHPMRGTYTPHQHNGFTNLHGSDTSFVGTLSRDYTVPEWRSELQVRQILNRPLVVTRR